VGYLHEVGCVLPWCIKQHGEDFKDGVSACLCSCCVIEEGSMLAGRCEGYIWDIKENKRKKNSQT
jgi:hypothetical protein